MTRHLIARWLVGVTLLVGSFACSTENKTAAESGTAPAATTVAADSAANQPSGGAYVCPMHPDVTSDKPGACPQCGMALEKQG